MVAANHHPLESGQGSISGKELSSNVQLVLTDRTELSHGREIRVMWPHTWRLADLFANHAFLLNGLGWGGMPLQCARAYIESRRLVVLNIEDTSIEELSLPMSAIYRSDDAPGPAGRWLIERLKSRPRKPKFKRQLLHREFPRNVLRRLLVGGIVRRPTQAEGQRHSSPP